MKLTLKTFTIGLLIAPILALRPSTSSAQSKPVPQEVPVSLSYSQLTKCFPELKNEAWTRKVDLNELKDEVDRNFLTTQSLLQQREVLLKDPQTAAVKRLRLAARVKGGKKSGYDYHLTLEKLDAKGSGTLIEVPVGHRTNPEQKSLNTYFVNQEVQRDETSFYDTKLKGITANYKKNFRDVFEMELKDTASSRRVFCEQQKDLGVVCTCFSK